MSHSISRRQITDEERTRLLRAGRMTADNWAWVLAPMLGFGAIGFWVGKLLGHLLDVPSLGTITLGIGALAGFPLSIWLFRAFRSATSRIRDEIGQWEVEVIEVETHTVVGMRSTVTRGRSTSWISGQGRFSFCAGNGFTTPRPSRGVAAKWNPTMNFHARVSDFTVSRQAAVFFGSICWEIHWRRVVFFRGDRWQSPRLATHMCLMDRSMIWLRR